MKTRVLGAEFFHVDGQTNTTKLIVDFRNFANAPKNLGNACVCQAITRHAVRTRDIVFTYFNNQLNAQILLFYNNMYVTLQSSTCFEH